MRHNQGTVSENVDVLVLGAGISGLCLAHRVAQAGRTVLVLESAAQPGGCVRSQQEPAGYWFEMGAHTLYNSYGSLLTIIDELGLRDRMLARKRAPYRLLVEGKLRSIPSQLRLPELFASAWHAFSERKQGQTVADYYGKLVGRRNWKRVFSPLFAAVPSQPADNFPAEILFKKRPRRKDVPRSFTFAGGIQTLTDRIAAEPKIAVRTNAEVRGLARTGGNFVVEIAGGDRVFAQRLALALPAPEAANLLAPLAPEIATALADIQTAKIESVGIVAEAGQVRLPRLAGIVPIDDTFFSVVTRDVIPDERLRAFTFHFRAGLSLDERVERICAVIGLGRDQLACVATHATSLPSLALGHSAIAEEIDRRLPASGLYITGNYFGGLAIEDCSLRSAKEAERLVAETRS
ncbi:MAG TPA: FAD-dependent oxidoreductase [Polyangia bacterium]|jgi:Protoporphyrinogen oxidase|nr:FAD-dependent oxidoreductase [Polyangia bacterium]